MSWTGEPGGWGVRKTTGLEKGGCCQGAMLEPGGARAGGAAERGVMMRQEPWPVLGETHAQNYVSPTNPTPL